MTFPELADKIAALIKEYEQSNSVEKMIEGHYVDDGPVVDVFLATNGVPLSDYWYLNQQYRLEAKTLEQLVQLLKNEEVVQNKSCNIDPFSNGCC